LGRSTIVKSIGICVICGSLTPFQTGLVLTKLRKTGDAGEVCPEGCAAIGEHGGFAFVYDGTGFRKSGLKTSFFY
jgi:hypothetical protein